MLLASIPMILLYVFGQRFFIRGLTAGAVKG
jgi:ABC-type glycerol-3-phosphate transport system permease component